MLHISRNEQYIIYDMFTCESETTRGLQFQLSCRKRRILKVTASHVHCKCGNILETVTNIVVVTTNH